MSGAKTPTFLQSLLTYFSLFDVTDQQTLCNERIVMCSTPIFPPPRPFFAKLTARDAADTGSMQYVTLVIIDGAGRRAMPCKGCLKLVSIMPRCQ